MSDTEQDYERYREISLRFRHHGVLLRIYRNLLLKNTGPIRITEYDGAAAINEEVIKRDFRKSSLI
jgi:hypothetical protein